MTLDTTLANLIRLTDNKITCTGGVVFVGDGGTGKTHTAMNLTSAKGKWYYQKGDNLRKSINLELDYFIFQSYIEEYNLTTSSQFFILPGQKGRAEKGSGLAFEDAADLFLSTAPTNVVVALVLTYKITEMNTFQELEYWLSKAIERDLIMDFTSVIILGTHLDQEEQAVVTEEHLLGAKDFVRGFILSKKGIDLPPEYIHPIEVSNVTKEGLDELKEQINLAFLRAFHIEEIVDYLLKKQ